MAGHVWERDEEGKVVIYGDHHAGPSCVVCGAGDCDSCNRGFWSEECTLRTEQPTLPGLDWEELPVGPG